MSEPPNYPTRRQALAARANTLPEIAGYRTSETMAVPFVRVHGPRFVQRVTLFCACAMPWAMDSRAESRLHPIEPSPRVRGPS